MQLERSLGLMLPASTLLALSLSASAQVGYEWGREFDSPNLPYGEIRSSVVYDDGTGPALYLGGNFWQINGEGAFSIVRFDGTDWAPLDGGLNNNNVPADVKALAVFDPDGAGPAKELLVVGGLIHQIDGKTPPVFGAPQVNNIATWDGANWSTLGNGISGAVPGWSWPEVHSLQAFDDGTGPKLYAGGIFKFGQFRGLAVWDGTTWGPVAATGLSGGWADALEVYDDGSGPALYVGGSFSAVIGTANTAKIARWDGSSFTSVASGFGDVQGFTKFDADGSGPVPEKLVAAGHGALDVWDGASLTHVTGFSAPLTPAVLTFDDGNGPAVYLGSNGVASFEGHRLHKWDGVSSSMVQVGSWIDGYLGTTFVETMVEFQGEIFAGGYFTGTASANSRGLLKWDGSDWVTPFASGGIGFHDPASGVSFPQAYGAVSFDAGNGPELFLGGTFNRAGNTVINSGVAAWGGQSWRDAGPITTAGAVSDATPLGTWDDGSGLGLYLGVNDSGVNKVFRLNSSGWSEVGAASAAFANRVSEMAIFDDGSGPSLFVNAGADVHKWDGTSWSLIATTGVGTTGIPLRAMRVFDDGSGAALFVSGYFPTIAGVTVNNIAKFDGANWTALGSGADNGASTMATMDDGSGNALYLSGAFGSVDGVANTVGIAKWDGTAWSAVGGGVQFVNHIVGTYNDGSTTRLYCSGGEFGQSTWGTFMRTWDGNQWVKMTDSYSTSAATGMLEHDDGLSQGVYFWGSFHGMGGTEIKPDYIGLDSGTQSSGLVRWGLPNSPFNVSGFGCSQYSSDIPTIHGAGLAQTGSASFVTSVKNVPAGLPAALIVGTDTNFWLGIPLPLDLAVMGWAGCNLYQSWDFTFWTVTGGVGTTGGVASMPLVIPSQASLVGLNLGLQWAVISPTPVGIDIGVTPLGEVVVE